MLSLLEIIKKLEVTMKKVFLNVTAHNMSGEQLDKARKLAGEVKNLKDINPELASKLANSPDNLVGIMELVYELKSFCLTLARDYEEVYVHLPIGSPAFMFALARELTSFYGEVTPVFSHSERISVEEQQPDGSVIKRAVFRFKKFIIFSEEV